MNIYPASGIKGSDVVEVMEHIKSVIGLPDTIKVDNGLEFTSKNLNKWTYKNGLELDFFRPRKPTNNAIIESFNRSFRDECLSIHLE